jgi:hypothetical protein
MVANKKVQALLRAFLNSGKSEHELDLEEIQTHLDHAEPGSVAAQRLLALKNSLKRGIKPERDPEEAAEPAAERKHEPESQVPADALEVWSDKATGVVIGYRAASGVAVKL